MGVRQLYEQTLAERGFHPDPAQERAIDSLERCESEWADYKARRANAIAKLIAEAVVAMEFKASAEDIGRICHAHPSLSEATKEAALAVDKRALNF